MNDRFREILDNLPDAMPRSCLGPYKELILELRHRKRPYREIADLLAEKCGIRVSHSTLHEFVQRHLSKGRASAEECAESGAGKKMATQPARESRAATPDEVRERIEALKRKSASSPNQPMGFQFDGSKPLRLRPGKT